MFFLSIIYRVNRSIKEWQAAKARHCYIQRWCANTSPIVLYFLFVCISRLPLPACLLNLLGGSSRGIHLPRPRRRLGQRDAGGPIPIPARPSHGPGGGAALPSPHEADGGAHVDEKLGGIELAGDAELRRGVVEGVLVVPVVPPLTDGAEGDEGVLGGVRAGRRRGGRP